MSDKRENPACANPYPYDAKGMPLPDFLRSIARYPANYVPVHADTLLKLADEIEQLCKEAQVAKDLHDSLGIHWGNDPYINIKELQRDAERYRFLRGGEGIMPYLGVTTVGEMLDHGIDRAMAVKAESRE